MKAGNPSILLGAMACAAWASVAAADARAGPIPPAEVQPLVVAFPTAASAGPDARPDASDVVIGFRPQSVPAHRALGVRAVPSPQALPPRAAASRETVFPGARLPRADAAREARIRRHLRTR